MHLYIDIYIGLGSKFFLEDKKQKEMLLMNNWERSDEDQQEESSSWESCKAERSTVIFKNIRHSLSYFFHYSHRLYELLCICTQGGAGSEGDGPMKEHREKGYGNIERVAREEGCGHWAERKFSMHVRPGRIGHNTIHRSKWRNKTFGEWWRHLI